MVFERVPVHLLLLSKIEQRQNERAQNGLGMLREREVVRGAKLELTPEFRSREKIAALAEEIDQYLR